MRDEGDISQESVRGQVLHRSDSGQWNAAAKPPSKLNGRTGAASANFKRCVIYTRKSSEEGLEQDFNSLDAQKEACEAYIQSQRQEGWRLLRPGSDQAVGFYSFDDGGLSGGTMERPGLLRLLALVEAGEVDVVVVYKVDRLTRSLADFARIVDVFDRHGVSFVSVTQAFNTTSSMGRLTLNVLLSFAQFERKVTAERIRDKIAASKRKGMWMGGPVPLGYRVKDRKLLIHEEEAKTVQRVFETYLKTRSLPQIKAELDDAGILTRSRVRSDGTRTGGNRFSTSSLSAMLRNPIYRGQIAHKGEVFEGEHDGIIPSHMFDAVQASLAASPANSRRNPARPTGPVPGRLFQRRIFDSAGFPMTTTYAPRNGVRHNYYLSMALARNMKDKAGKPHRVPSAKLEPAVLEVVRRAIIGRRTHGDRLASNDLETKYLDLTSNSNISDANLLALVERVDVVSTGARVTLKDAGGFATELLDVSIDWSKPIKRRQIAPRHSNHLKQNRMGKQNAPNTQERLAQAVARGHRWYADIKSGKVQSITELAEREGKSVRVIRLGLRLAWLAPDIVIAALDHKLDPSLTATELAFNLPNLWDDQRKLVGLADQ